ncbi:MAG: radical SAM protein [Clostridium sp.]|nr:radical SAM protein [Clostridium sp.]
MRNPLKRIANIIKRWHELRSMPLRLEFVVTDYCNLNCKGCTHYSSLAAKEFADISLLKHNMRHLSAICSSKLKSAYLIGGETLLYPHLIEAMEAMRKCFPSQCLYVFTNGLALPRMSDDFWEAASRLDFTIAITRYPIKFDYDAVIELCKRRGAKAEVFGDRSLAESFFKFRLDPEKAQNPRVSHFKCYNRGCLSIIGARLYPCSISGCVSHLNKACGTDFQHLPGDFIEIDSITSIKQIMRLRDKPVPFCGYCVLPPQEVAYGPSKRVADEWI